MFILIYVVFLVFSLNYCFAAVVLIATNKVEYITSNRVIHKSSDEDRDTDIGNMYRKFREV